MSDAIAQLFRNNREWVARVNAEDPTFFTRLANQQAPEYLWIGCSDSRVPANQILGLAPGEVFVHRNIANVISHSDLNALSVLQFAVDVLRVQHIMVVGHYGCGGVSAAVDGRRRGLVDIGCIQFASCPEGTARNSKRCGTSTAAWTVCANSMWCSKSRTWPPTSSCSTPGHAGRISRFMAGCIRSGTV